MRGPVSVWLCACVSVCLCVCASVHLHISASVCLCISASVHLCVCVSVCKHICVCLCICASVCQCICAWQMARKGVGGQFVKFPSEICTYANILLLKGNEYLISNTIHKLIFKIFFCGPLSQIARREHFLYNFFDSCLPLNQWSPNVWLKTKKS